MSNSTKNRRGFGPRFSLRTLVVFVLAVGSVGLAWWDWGAWVPEVQIDEEGTLSELEFLGAQSEYVTGKLKVQGAGRGESHEERIILDARTGKRLGWTRQRHLLPTISFSESGEYCRWAVVNQPLVLTRIADGLEIDLSKELGSSKTYAFSPRDRYLTVVAPNGRTRLLRFPSLEVVREYGVAKFVDFMQYTVPPMLSHDETWTADVLENEIELARLESGEVFQRLPFQGQLLRLIIAPTDDKVAIVSSLDLKRTVRVYAVQTGKVLLERKALADPLMRQRSKNCGIEFSENGKFVFIESMTKDFGNFLSKDNLVSPEIWKLEPEARELGISRDDIVIPGVDWMIKIENKGTSAWDLNSGAMKWRRGDAVNLNKWNRFGVAGLSAVVVDCQTGENLFHVHGFRWSEWIPKGQLIFIKFAPHGDNFLTRSTFAQHDPVGSDAWAKRAVIWRMRRPVEWWGCFWMWEVWVAGVFVMGLGWSVWGDRRIGSKG